MSYEFKKLSDVEVVAEPIETANVLIEEDGVVKKAPKSAIGGASIPEIILKVTYNEDTDIETTECSHSYDELCSLLNSGNLFKGFLFINEFYEGKNHVSCSCMKRMCFGRDYMELWFGTNEAYGVDTSNNIFGMAM